MLNLSVALVLALSAGVPLSTNAASATPVVITPDGGNYQGQLRDGKMSGKGKIEWANGASYEGGFENGLFSGKGKYRSSTGVAYEGDYEKGMMQGNGRYVTPDGKVYVGQFANDEFNGKGRYDMTEGSVYDGSFVNSMFDGAGKWTSAEEEYIGDFKKGKYAGQGEIKYKAGGKYKGGFANGVYQGKGRFEKSNGQIYEGTFDKGEFVGQGVFQSRDGARHAGSFAKWRPQGPGTYTDAKGNVYEGTFVEGELAGKGRFIGKDGSRYEGDFKNWQFHGQGVSKDPKGNEYKGGFAYGSYSGEGVLTYAVPQKDGKTKESGTWRYGILEDPEAEKQMKANVETALYNQRALLDKTLAAIQPHAPGAINLYFLAVGGDGSQEVFHRETEFVRTQFDRDFGTRGRSVVLVNSRNTAATTPMATLTSIRESLRAISGKMDKENDILFLFLTSHGSATHELTLDQNGMNLYNLPAKELATYLKDSGIRWKVIVVSACYSGGFIDPLKDERTLILTAARRDRTSFGCADENDFTYFGKAYFRDALPKSASFSDAFNKAKSLVAKWEAEDFKASDKTEKENHSEPQIHKGALIEDYLKTWRAQLAKAQRNNAVAKIDGGGKVMK